MDELIKTIIREWKEKLPGNIHSRETDLKDFIDGRVNKIIAVTGFRRVGKSYLMFDALEKIEEKSLYVNFEDERIPLKTEFLTDLWTAAKSGDIKYLFLDELQEMPNWGKWLRRVYDSGSVRICVSGSSSKVSSREIPTELRGRSLEVKINPLSMREFLEFRGVPENDAASYCGEYIRYGGMPEVVLSEEARKKILLQEYYNTLVRKDLVERHSIRDEEALKALMKLLLDSKQYTITKLANTLKSLGYAVGKSTVQRYVSHMEDAYFLYSLQVFSTKIKDSMQAPRKVYLVDNGFIQLASEGARGNGRLYENAIFNHLRQSLDEDKELAYWKDSRGHEVDFLLRSGGRAMMLVQACYDPADAETRRRETRSLIKASEDTGCNNLIVVTSGYEGSEDAEWYGVKRTIRFVPIWKFLLSAD